MAHIHIRVHYLFSIPVCLTVFYFLLFFSFTRSSSPRDFIHLDIYLIVYNSARLAATTFHLFIRLIRIRFWAVIRFINGQTEQLYGVSHHTFLLMNVCIMLNDDIKGKNFAGVDGHNFFFFFLHCS